MVQRARRNPFHLIREGHTEILIHPDFQRQLQAMGIERVRDIIEKARIDPHRRGRQVCRVFAPGQVNDRRYVIRHYTRGGLFRRLLGDRFLFGSRPFREIMITEEIRSRGLPTARPLAALRHPAGGFFYRGDLITEEIPESQDLASFFSSGRDPLSQGEPALRHEVASQAGRTVRFMHDHGVYHGDLNLKNLLVQPVYQSHPTVYVIDLDRSTIRTSLSTRARIRNLLRLNRSVEKLKRKGVCVRYSDRARFFHAYAQSDPMIVRAMKDQLKRDRLWVFWHRMAWAFDRLVNPSDPS
jgi:tRNA A-37 threonylcarbamoyl transferase component Bud32